MEPDDIFVKLLDVANKQKKKAIRKVLIFVVLGYAIALTVGLLIGKFLL